MPDRAGRSIAIRLDAAWGWHVLTVCACPRYASPMVCEGDQHAARTWVMCVVTLAGFACCTPLNDKISAVSRDGGSPSGDAAADVESDCERDEDCPASSACAPVSCRRGSCVIRSSPDGTSLPADQQVEGDCRKVVCDGHGRLRTESDDSDTQGDGNPCHEVRCVAGTREVSDAADGTSCNSIGVCRSGVCSVCTGGSDCSRPSDCEEYRVTCEGGVFKCESTGVPRPGRSCDAGKVCHEGSCIPCVVGAECDVNLPCHAGRIVGCGSGRACEPQPVSGMSCGTDAMGQTLYCVDGRCAAPCQDGPCMTAQGPCWTSSWDCSRAGEPPECVAVELEDGSSCGPTSVCQAGECATRSLVNGDFSRGLEGWELTGDAADFPIAADLDNYGRLTLSTSPAVKRGAALGTVSQTFSVPADALAIRFNLSGGRARVRLNDSSGAVLQEVTGVDSNSSRIPVSWDVTNLRGQRVTLAIEDDLDSGDWASIDVTGFDVVRDVDGPIRNADWGDGFAGWESTGDGLYFNIFDDYNYATGSTVLSGVSAYGRRVSVSTFGRDPAAMELGDATQGTLSQSFMVPNDALALRFNVGGGDTASVRLFHGNELLYEVVGRDTDRFKVPVSWPLESFRGMSLRLLITDSDRGTPFGYIGVSSFDLITPYNGP